MSVFRKYVEMNIWKKVLQSTCVSLIALAHFIYIYSSTIRDALNVHICFLAAGNIRGNKVYDGLTSFTYAHLKSEFSLGIFPYTPTIPAFYTNSYKETKFTF